MEPVSYTMHVPPQTLIDVLNLIDGINGSPGRSAALAGDVAGLIAEWDAAVVMRALGLIIGTAMTAMQPPDEGPDRLHLVVPAVLTRLGQLDLARSFMPIMAGVLTAAALKENPCGWRETLGPVADMEIMAWCCTAWLLADLADTAMFGHCGGFTAAFADMVTRAAEDEDPVVS